MSGCNCGTTSKDQTPDEVADYLTAEYKAGRATGREPAGIGIFLVADPEQGALRFKKVIVPDITYHEAGLRGLACTAFKWFPYGMTLDVDGQKVQVDDRVNCDEAICTLAPCRSKQYCGDPRCCFCTGDFFGWGLCQ